MGRADRIQRAGQRGHRPRDGQPALADNGQFRTAVAAVTGLEDAWTPGIQALSAADRHRVSSGSAALTGSVALDDALRSRAPTSNRWDYAVGESVSNQTPIIHWIEVHPATLGEVKTVLAKLEWLRDWLLTDGKRLDLPHFSRRFVWIASGTTAISPRSQQLRILAEKGLHLVGRHYHLAKVLPATDL